MHYKVWLGGDKELDVCGRGSVAVNVQGEGIKLIHGVIYVPKLAHNLLSVGQLIGSGFNVNFSNCGCNIENVETGVQVLYTQRNEHNLFPVEFSKDEKINVAMFADGLSSLWYRRFDHQNFQGLHVLHEYNMLLVF